MSATRITPSHVHIIGAGLGGLTLARVLQLSNVAVTVYEREPNAASRTQGGTLDLHGETGQRAMHIANLHDEFEAHCNRLADTMMIRGKDGEIVWQDESHESKSAGENTHSDEDRPEIDRGVLRKILLDSLEPGTVQWGHTLRSITSIAGAHQLVFETGTSSPKTVSAEFVVGADGAWSRTRTLLTDAVPVYQGVSFIETEVLDIDDKHPNIARLVGDGTMFAVEEQKGLIAQRNTGGRCNAYLALRVPQSWVADSHIPFDSDPEETRERLLELLEGWDERIREVVRVAEPKFIPRPIMALDPKTRWENQEGITLLGDAAHVISPFAGEGANLAMIDAAELGYALLGKNHVGKEGVYRTQRDAVRAYENRMFTRFKPAAEESRSNMNLFISDQAPHAAAELMKFQGRPLAYVAHLILMSIWRLFARLW